MTRAASILGIAQPALTRQIRQLEGEVGTSLFDRVRRGVNLTPAGKVLLDATHSLFERVDLAVRHARETDAGTRGLVRVGLGRIATDHPSVGRALATARSRYPAVELDIRDLPSWDQPAALLSRELDVAIGAVDFIDDGVIANQLLCEDVVDTAVVPSGHPLAARGSATLEELFALRYLTLDSHLGAFPRLLDALRKAGLEQYEPHPTVESIYNMVAAGRGWCCAPHSMRVHPPVGTTLISLKDFSAALPIFVGWRATNGSAAITNIVSALLEAMERPTVRQRPGAMDDQMKAAEPMTKLVHLEHLRTLAVVISEGSMGRAGTRLGLSQPVVSRRLSSLRRATGLDLVKCASNGVVATAAGRFLATEAKDLLSHAAQVIVRVRQASQGITSSYTIGTLPPEIVGARLRSALQQIHDRLPHVQVSVLEMSPEQALDAVAEGRLDVALTAPIPGTSVNSGLAWVFLDEDPLDCVLLSHSHPLANRAWLTAADLKDVPFVIPKREMSPRMHDGIMRALDAAGLRPEPVATFESPRLTWRAAENSTAWTIGRHSQRSQPPTGMAAVPLEGFHLPSGNMLVWRPCGHDTELRQVVEMFRAGGGMRADDFEVGTAPLRLRSRD